MRTMSTMLACIFLVAVASTAIAATDIVKAARDGDLIAVKQLLQSGADVNAKDATGKTALHWAAYEGRPVPPTIAARQHYTEIAEVLLENGADVAAKDKYGRTPLHIAAWFGADGIAKLLLSKHADVNAVDKTGQSPLHRAAYRAQSATVSLLIASGAKINTKDIRGRTPLYFVYMGHMSKAEKAKAAKILRDHGAK